MTLHCYQCSRSQSGACGADGTTIGTCGKSETLARLEDIIVFGLKGVAAYRVQADHYGVDTKAVDDVLSQALYFTLTNVNFNFQQHVDMLMQVGAATVEVMKLLDEAHVTAFGRPRPVTVAQDRVEGKAILVSGHDHHALRQVLEQSAGKGINVYTHSEMLPAHAYPELARHPHLKGNVGKSWFDQSKLFANFSGAILVTTNCIVPPKNESYASRLFTTGGVGIEGSRVIDGSDFSPLIERALELPETNWESSATLATGHHHSVILSLAPQILEAVQAGKIRHFFVIAGCDAPGSGGYYYRELALALPEDCVILTSSCGKFRFNDIDFGFVPGTAIPRYLDLGQCNDSVGGVFVALKLAEALGCTVNDLPLSIVLSWMEQKAVAILLGLFSLGVKNIRVGPKAPQFVNKEIFGFLDSQFGLKLTSDPRSDLAEMLGDPELGYDGKLVA